MKFRRLCHYTLRFSSKCEQSMMFSSLGHKTESSTVLRHSPGSLKASYVQWDAIHGHSLMISTVLEVEILSRTPIVPSDPKSSSFPL